MKLVKSFSLSVILKLAAALFAIVAFVMMFPKQILVDLGGSSITYGIGDITFINGGIVVGYILAIVAAIVIIVGSIFEFKNKMVNLIVLGVGAVLVLVGTIMIFCVPSMISGAVENCEPSGATELAVALAIAGGKVSASAGPVIGGICGIVSVLAVAGGVVVEKFLKK